MAKIYIYSTLTSDQVYAQYTRPANGVPQVESKIKIKGGANLMTRHMVTPQGVVTEVTAEELSILRSNEVFKLHETNGFITVSEGKETSANIERAVSDMTGRDQSAPMVEQDEIVPVPAADDGEDEAPRRRGRSRKGV